MKLNSTLSDYTVWKLRFNETELNAWRICSLENGAERAFR
jgi:hypothetical protein